MPGYISLATKRWTWAKRTPVAGTVQEIMLVVSLEHNIVDSSLSDQSGIS